MLLLEGCRQASVVCLDLRMLSSWQLASLSLSSCDCGAPSSEHTCGALTKIQRLQLPSFRLRPQLQLPHHPLSWGYPHCRTRPQRVCNILRLELPIIASTRCSSCPITRSPSFLPVVACAQSVFVMTCEFNSPDIIAWCWAGSILGVFAQWFFPPP